MLLPDEGYLLRIFIGEADRYEGRPLYEWIVLQARAQGMSGATVVRGLMGFGSGTRQIHSFRFETLSEDLPIIIELVDSEQNLAAFLGHIEGALSAGLVTMEKARVKFHRPGRQTIGAQTA